MRNIFAQSLSEAIDDDIDPKILQGNSIATQILGEVFQKQAENPNQKDLLQKKVDEQKENEWYDQEFEKAIQNYAKISNMKMQDERKQMQLMQTIYQFYQVDQEIISYSILIVFSKPKIKPSSLSSSSQKCST